MKVVAGPYYIKGRGDAYVLSLAAGERAEVGDRLLRADGATWTLTGVEIGSTLPRGTLPRGACILRGDVALYVGDELARVGS